MRGNLNPFNIMPDSQTAPKIYVQLLHGRNTPDEALSDWGSSGPCLGPFDWFHSTYLTTMTFGTIEEGEVWDIRDSLVGDLIHYDGVYYGDFEIVPTPKDSGPVTVFDPSKALTV